MEGIYTNKDVAKHWLKTDEAWTSKLMDDRDKLLLTVRTHWVRKIREREKNNKVYLRTLMQCNISRISYTVELHYVEEIVSVGELWRVHPSDTKDQWSNIRREGKTKIL